MRNYAASENPPRRFRRWLEKSRQKPLRSTIGHPPISQYVSLWRLPAGERLALIEAIERFDRLHVGA